MSATTHCPVCGSPMDGTCRRCLVDGLFGEEVDRFDLPDELGGFRLLERIGRGASGEVWMAFQPGPDRKVAVKVFLDPRLGGSADRSRFRAEAQALGKLDDPGIVPVYATGEDGGFLFIASRWMSGGTLAERGPMESGRKAWRRIARMVEIIAKAVAHAHGHGLVHRDIKPANILLDEQGEPYLADFGIAEAEGLRDEGTTSGTPAYMAPEQARGETVTTAADIYSLGALMYDLLTGHPPPPGDEARLGELESVDADLAAVCLKSLSAEPSDRYQSALGLAADLEAWRRGEPVTARAISPAARLVKWARRRPALATLSVLVGLTALILGITLVVGSDALRRERNEAVKQEGIAREQEQIARATASDFREHAYAADIYLASRALEDGQLGVARQMLDRHLDDGGEVDVRGFEWYAYRSRCEGEEEDCFTGHTGVVSAVGFSPDGRFLASGGWDGQVFVRELATGDVVLRLPHPEAPPRGAAEIPLMTKVLARSPELRELVFSGDLNVDEFRMRGRPSRLGELTALAWSPDGRLLATACAGSYVRLWNAADGELRAALPVQHGQRLAFSECGRFLVTLDGPNGINRILVHEVEGLQRRHTIPEVGPVLAVKGGMLAYQSVGDSSLRLVRLEDMQELVNWAAGRALADLVFSADGKRLVGVDQEGKSELTWTLEGRELKVQDEPIRGVSRVLTRVGQGVAMAGTGQMVGVRPGVAADSVRLLRGHEDEIMDLGASSDGRWVASASKDWTVRLWRVDGGTSDGGASRQGLPALKAHSADGLAWLSETDDRRVFLGQAGGAQFQLGADQPCKALVFSADGSRVATWRDEDEGVVIDWWSSENGEALRSTWFEVTGEAPRVVAVGGGKLVVTSRGAAVQWFDLQTGAKLGELLPEGGDILRMEIAPDGEQVAAFYWPRRVRVGRLGGEWLGPWELTSGILGPMVFSPDGTLLASGNNENRVVVHDARTGELVKILLGHREPLVALAFSPDGRSLVSSSKDRTVRLWHAPTWRDLGVFERGSLVGYFGFKGDGSGLLMGAWGQTPRLVPETRKTPPPR